MSFNPFPYIEGAQKATKNYGENRSMDDILKQSREAQNSQGQDDVMTQVLQRLPPEKRADAMQYIQNRQAQQRAKESRSLQAQALQTQGIDPSIANLDPAIQKEIIKGRSQNAGNEKQMASQNALNLINTARGLTKTGHLGPKVGIIGTGRNLGSTWSSEGQRVRAEYKQLGKALVQAAAPLKITNKAEFLHYAEDLEDPNRNLEDIEGSLNALERIIRNSLGEHGNQQSNASQNSQAQGSLTTGNNQISDGQTATGPNGQKIIFKGGQWQPM
jgi:hypothetical protein